MYKVDLNSDLGESFGAYTIGLDEAVIAHISSANVACGYHALMAFTAAHGVKLQHCKPHGSLYNMAAKDMDLSLAIAEAIAEVDKDIILMGLAGSKMLEAGKQVGLRVASEVFGAVIHDKDEAIARTIRMVTEGKVTAITGEEVSIDAHSICVHGDNPSAVEFVKNIRAALNAQGVEIAPIAAIV